MDKDLEKINARLDRIEHRIGRIELTPSFVRFNVLNPEPKAEPKPKSPNKK